jgi:hypothetical protein
VTLFPIAVVIPKNVQGAKEPGNFQVSALDKALLGTRLEGSIELIDQRLNHRLEQFAGGLENQFPERPFERQKLLFGRLLI